MAFQCFNGRRTRNTSLALSFQRFFLNRSKADDFGNRISNQVFIYAFSPKFFTNSQICEQNVINCTAKSQTCNTFFT